MSDVSDNDDDYADSYDCYDDYDPCVVIIEEFIIGIQCHAHDGVGLWPFTSSLHRMYIFLIN